MTNFQITKPAREIFQLFKWLDNCRSKDSNRMTLTCILVSNNGTVFQATDGFKLAVAFLTQAICDDKGIYIKDGVWEFITVNKQLIMLQNTEDLNNYFPKTDFLTKPYPVVKEEDKEEVNCIAFSPFVINPIIKPFSHATISFINTNTPVHIYLTNNGDFPEGEYIGVIMPYISTARYEEIQTVFSNFEKILKPKKESEEK